MPKLYVMSFSEFNVAFSIYALLKWYDLFAKLWFNTV